MPRKRNRSNTNEWWRFPRLPNTNTNIGFNIQIEIKHTIETDAFRLGEIRPRFH